MPSRRRGWWLAGLIIAIALVPLTLRLLRTAPESPDAGSVTSQVKLSSPVQMVEPRATEPTTAPAPKQQLRLQLLAVMSASDSRYSRATIRDIETGVHSVLALEDQLPSREDTYLTDIGDDWAEITGPAGVTTLVLDPDAVFGADAEDDPDAADTVARLRKFAAAGESYKGLLMVQWSRIGKREEADLQSQANFAPAYAPDDDTGMGPMTGLLLTGVMQGSLYEQMGLRSGDVIESINGLRVDSPEATEMAIPILKEETQLSVEVLRDGDRLSFDTRTVKPR